MELVSGHATRLVDKQGSYTETSGYCTTECDECQLVHMSTMNHTVDSMLGALQHGGTLGINGLSLSLGAGLVACMRLIWLPLSRNH